MSTSDTAQPAAGPTEFPKFNKLPREIRYMIWNHALDNDLGGRMMGLFGEKWMCGSLWEESTCPYEMQQPVPAILYASNESRTLAQEYIAKKGFKMERRRRHREHMLGDPDPETGAVLVKDVLKADKQCSNGCYTPPEFMLKLKAKRGDSQQTAADGDTTTSAERERKRVAKLILGYDYDMFYEWRPCLVRRWDPDHDILYVPRERLSWMVSVAERMAEGSNVVSMDGLDDMDDPEDRQAVLDEEAAKVDALRRLKHLAIPAHVAVYGLDWYTRLAGYLPALERIHIIWGPLPLPPSTQFRPGPFLRQLNGVLYSVSEVRNHGRLFYDQDEARRLGEDVPSDSDDEDFDDDYFDDVSEDDIGDEEFAEFDGDWTDDDFSDDEAAEAFYAAREAVYQALKQQRQADPEKADIRYLARRAKINWRERLGGKNELWATCWRFDEMSEEVPDEWADAGGGKGEGGDDGESGAEESESEEEEEEEEDPPRGPMVELHHGDLAEGRTRVEVRGLQDAMDDVQMQLAINEWEEGFTERFVDEWNGEVKLPMVHGRVVEIPMVAR